jgi:hypothetical protein
LINGTKKNGAPSLANLLPKDLRQPGDKEYKKTSDKKRRDTKKGKQHSEQPKKIAKKTAKYRD